MGLVKAVRNYVLRSANNARYHKEQRRAQKQAYSETGKVLTKAKRRGQYVNGRVVYRKKYSSAMKKVDEKYDLRNKFIDDL